MQGYINLSKLNRLLAHLIVRVWSVGNMGSQVKRNPQEICIKEFLGVGILASYLGKGKLGGIINYCYVVTK